MAPRARKWSLGRSRSLWKDKVRVLGGAGHRPRFVLPLSIRRHPLAIHLCFPPSIVPFSSLPTRFFMPWIASGVSNPYLERSDRGYYVSRRVDLSYRRSHNGLFYLISSLVDRLPPRPLSPSRLRRGNGKQEETWLASRDRQGAGSGIVKTHRRRSSAVKSLYRPSGRFLIPRHEIDASSRFFPHSVVCWSMREFSVFFFFFWLEEIL